jgi:Predicted glycosyltransferases
MKLTVEFIVCTLNRPDCIEKLLASILLQSQKPNKVTIVDAGTVSADYDRYRQGLELAGINFFVLKSNPGLTHQRNVGIKQMDCDLVVFSDDDVVLDNKYVMRVLNIFENDTEQFIGGATGNMLNFKNTTTFFSRTFRRMFYLGRVKNGALLSSGFGLGIDYKNQALGEIGWLSGCNMVFRREVFEGRWFDENLCRYAYMEDIDFSYRVSKQFRLVYIPEACYHHFQAPQGRLKDAERYAMLLRHHHYLFKKNLKASAKTVVPHYISLIGVVIQALLLQRSLRGFSGAARGLFEILFMRNYRLPNYLERLDYSKPSRVQIAEHEFRYEFAANLCKGGHVLDCAVGEGIGAKILAKSAQKVTGVDIDPKTLQSAKDSLKGFNVELVCASAINLPFPNEHFDAITSIETIEHLPEHLHEQMLTEFRRVLKKDGVLILSAPNIERSSKGKIAPSNYFHLKEFRFEELSSLLEKFFRAEKKLGLYNPQREPSVENLKVNISEPMSKVKEIGLKKKILKLVPFEIRDLLSVLLNRKHIYPDKTEYVLIEDNAYVAADLIFVMRNSK